MTVSLHRAERTQCSADWRGDHIIPPFCSIGFIMDGAGTIIADDTEMHPSPGQLYLLPAKTTQTFYTVPEHPYEKYYCHFDLHCQGHELFDILQAPLLVDAADPREAIQLFEAMIQAFQSPSIISAIQANQSFLNLLVYYLECCPAGSIHLTENTIHSPISGAIAYAETHLGQVNVQKMAEIAGYHPSHFTKLFQKQLGLSPARFLIRKKAGYAMEQLSTSARPISDIAAELGFSDSFYFSSFFKKQTGMTPSQYRVAYGQAYRT